MVKCGGWVSCLRDKEHSRRSTLQEGPRMLGSGVNAPCSYPSACHAPHGPLPPLLGNSSACHAHICVPPHSLRRLFRLPLTYAAASALLRYILSAVSRTAASALLACSSPAIVAYAAYPFRRSSFPIAVLAIDRQHPHRGGYFDTVSRVCR
jgi:hypothetical protein